ncbi:hypothetical protein J6590_038785 [Homalodisca vitripennis]|nr:hypothetical protein J6590_038785 [Homalodisca vitripennis]
MIDSSGRISALWPLLEGRCREQSFTAAMCGRSVARRVVLPLSCHQTWNVPAHVRSRRAGEGKARASRVARPNSAPAASLPSLLVCTFTVIRGEALARCGPAVVVMQTPCKTAAQQVTHHNIELSDVQLGLGTVRPCSSGNANTLQDSSSTSDSSQYRT